MIEVYDFRLDIVVVFFVRELCYIRNSEEKCKSRKKLECHAKKCRHIIGKMI